ncbi:hypothetical protein LX64_03732 [Chitinophaga skermanii]|uniref:Uncharacterized protein n=1 Tax=Chitinophaga skermanii TaxID=331697 RepID=A0A327QII5_9BACT|nr:hypothetical protein [Chitinophaga skermanii]RAJ01517.1 hypothetical protein LX64_03732 [Chitinophaga skermanii]
MKGLIYFLLTGLFFVACKNDHRTAWQEQGLKGKVKERRIAVMEIDSNRATAPSDTVWKYKGTAKFNLSGLYDSTLFTSMLNDSTLYSERVVYKYMNHTLEEQDISRKTTGEETETLHGKVESLNDSTTEVRFYKNDVLSEIKLMTLNEKGYVHNSVYKHFGQSGLEYIAHFESLYRKDDNYPYVTITRDSSISIGSDHPPRERKFTVMSRDKAGNVLDVVCEEAGKKMLMRYSYEYFK